MFHGKEVVRLALKCKCYSKTGLGEQGVYQGAKMSVHQRRSEWGGVERSTSELMKEDREVILEGCIWNSWKQPAAVA